MATIINPITTVLLNRTEFESGEFDRFPFKYILESDGTISYFSKLSAGRYILSHEAQVKGLGTNKTVKAPEAIIQPLAHEWLVPGEMFDQIKQFFLDVMDMGPSTYEAQVFIVWNETSEEYRIVVPKQEVSAAAVRYDIADTLADDDVIIVDIHSHNTMNAFFSGTDDRDDKKNPWISGVFGKLTTNFEYKFRFNDGCGRHFPLNKEDIFDVEDARFQTPQEWLDQVSIQTYTPRTFGQSFGNAVGKHPSHPYNTDESEPFEWRSPNTRYVGGDSLEDLINTPDPEADLYDGVIISLDGLDNAECKNVIEAIITNLKDVNTPINLTDREMEAFTDLSFTLNESGDKFMVDRVLAEVRRGY